MEGTVASKQSLQGPLGDASRSYQVVYIGGAEGRGRKIVRGIGRGDRRNRGGRDEGRRGEEDLEVAYKLGEFGVPGDCGFRGGGVWQKKTRGRKWYLPPRGEVTTMVYALWRWCAR